MQQKSEFWIEVGFNSWEGYWETRLSSKSTSMIRSVNDYKTAIRYARRLSEATGLEIREVK